MTFCLAFEKAARIKKAISLAVLFAAATGMAQLPFPAPDMPRKAAAKTVNKARCEENGIERQRLQNLPVTPGPRRFDEGRGPGFALTAQESALVKGLFGADIVTEDVRLHFFSKENDEYYAVQYDSTAIVKDKDADKLALIEQTAEFCGAISFSANYATDDRAFCFGMFLHEMTHIWQGQHRDRLTAPGEKKTYLYSLKSVPDFSALQVERQAAVIEDYARRFLSPARADSYYDQDAVPKDTPFTDQALKQIVENFFPGARALREKAYPFGDLLPRKPPPVPFIAM